MKEKTSDERAERLKSSLRNVRKTIQHKQDDDEMKLQEEYDARSEIYEEWGW